MRATDKLEMGWGGPLDSSVERTFRGSVDGASQLGGLTGKIRANVSAKTPSRTNHSPTTISTMPPQRLTLGALARSRSAVPSCPHPTVKAAPNDRATIATAAAEKAASAAETPPVVSACPARPARIGPVQPNPMIR